MRLVAGSSEISQSVYELQDSRVSSDGTKERKEDIAGDTNMKDATNSFHKLVKSPSLHKKTIHASAMIRIETLLSHQCMLT